MSTMTASMLIVVSVITFVCYTLLVVFFPAWMLALAVMALLASFGVKLAMRFGPRWMLWDTVRVLLIALGGATAFLTGIVFAAKYVA